MTSGPVPTDPLALAGEGRPWISSAGAAVLLGPLAGLAFGIAARAWMRLVADDPEFTWSGTIAIVAVFTIVGALQGLALAVRRCGWRPRIQTFFRVLAAISMVLLAPAQGMVMFPALVLAALALGRPGWWSWVRAGLAAVALVESLAVAVVYFDLSAAREVLGWFLMVALYMSMALALALNLRPLARPHDDLTGPHQSNA